jgi:hypothetical protein
MRFSRLIGYDPRTVQRASGEALVPRVVDLLLTFDAFKELVTAEELAETNLNVLRSDREADRVRRSSVHRSPVRQVRSA